MKPSDIRTRLTAERLREVLDYEPETGAFLWKGRQTRSKMKAGMVAGYKNTDGYLLVRVHSHRYAAHRLAWLHFYGTWPVDQIDHINGIRDDNRIANLRDVSCQVNSQNQRRSHHRAIRNPANPGLLGTCFHRKMRRFVAYIQDPATRKEKYLGSFATAAEAHQAYIKEKRKIHEGNTL